MKSVRTYPHRQCDTAIVAVLQHRVAEQFFSASRSVHSGLSNEPFQKPIRAVLEWQKQRAAFLTRNRSNLIMY